MSPFSYESESSQVSIQIYCHIPRGIVPNATWIRFGNLPNSLSLRHKFAFVCEVASRYWADSWLCKIWGFHGCDYEEWRLLGYKNPVRTSQETHYVSATEYSRIMLCKICGYHGGDYEDLRLLGYKIPVRTSQETHYVSATETSCIMLCKIWGYHGGDYEECRLLGYKIPGRTSQETHYVSATETSRIILCKVWRYHSGDYEECRLLGYKIPVRTSQGTYYASATEHSLLILCRIWGFHGGDYEECRLLGCYAVWLLSEKPHGVTCHKTAFFTWGLFCINAQRHYFPRNLFHYCKCEKCLLPVRADLHFRPFSILSHKVLTLLARQHDQLRPDVPRERPRNTAPLTCLSLLLACVLQELPKQDCAHSHRSPHVIARQRPLTVHFQLTFWVFSMNKIASDSWRW
jgi:hypothetical protein